MSQSSVWGVIGDVHTEDQHLQTALNYFRAEQIEHIICVGDAVTGRGNAEAWCMLLRKNHISTALGNHDGWLIRFVQMREPYATRLSEWSVRSLRWL